jgi:tRNA-splicing endonuclease subunit Sen15, fungi type
MTEAAAGSHLEDLAKIVLNNLENQHDWTGAKVHSQANLPRPIIYGLPPKRLYVHPDEQVAIIRAEKNRRDRIPQPPELEWVLPLHLAEKWSPAQFAAVFDALEAIPPGDASEDASADIPDSGAEWKLWRGPKRGKRLLLATVQDDSTVTYYFMHDGLVKPRQN